ncbi:hypothetical protein Ahy_B07g088218 isoform A [Arachis hypogaea]|uniref:Partial AB-hydrolase lipase domain-containing protein n=1 Tax=Arachis hypogaea TaxID=3818 RepID=A0A444YDX2_ARAHY|nr:hypothetical protein Ahy_B07g088218 isoform A [Arachis hypogaea]
MLMSVFGRLMLLENSMANKISFPIVIIILVILFWGSAIAGGRRLYPLRTQSSDITALPSFSTEGICSSLVKTQGYACEEHLVTTVDGYVLSVPRIPVGRSRGPRGNRPPVLLQHGLFMQLYWLKAVFDSIQRIGFSDASVFLLRELPKRGALENNVVLLWMQDGITWLLLPPSQSLAFLLADNGFDVWIANTRGTKYSRQHISLPTNSSDYWNWSWDELVAYDLPATFQYVHDQTGQKLHYIGHSQGTLIALAALSKDQLLNMLRSAALLSPIAYVSQMTSPLAKNAADNFFAEYLYKLGIFEFSLRGDAVIQFLKDMCKKPGIDCTNLLTTFTGPNCCLSPSIVNIFLDHEPQSTATKNMIHLSQMIRQGTIAMFDYMNIDENTRHYGRPTPPVYDMTRIPNSLPLYLSYGGADALSDVKDVQRLLETLDDHDGDKLVVQYRNDYAHADYVMGENAKRDIYEPLISFFKLQ